MVAPGRLFAVALLALLLGFLGGRFSAREAPEKAPEAGARAAAVEALLDAPVGLERLRALTLVLTSLEPGEFPSVLRAFEESGYPPAEPYEIQLLFNAWASAAPEQALEAAMRWARGGQPGPAHEVLRTWGAEHPAVALQALESLQGVGPELRGPLALGLAAGWTRHGETEELTQFLMVLPPGPDLERVVRDLIWQLTLRGGLEAALAWAEALPSGENHEATFKRIAFRKIALSYGNSIPEQLARWLERHQEEQHGAAAIGVLGRTWAGSDPAAALLWAKQLSARLAREWGVGMAFEAWHTKDPDAAVAWLSVATGEDDSGALDSAISRYANVLASRTPRQPDAWLAWLDRMTVPHLRVATMLVCGKTWYTADREAAEAWLVTTELSETERDRVRGRRQPRRGDARKAEPS